MEDFNFEDAIRFVKAVFYNFKTIPLPKPFKDGTAGYGTAIPEQGYLELYDEEGACAHYTVSRNFVKDMLPKLMTNEKKSYNAWRNDLYWGIRNSGFQSVQAVNVGTVDLLMLDILAQRAQKPLHRFLGAEKDWACMYKGGGSIVESDEELVDEMSRYVSEGFTTVKFKVGSDTTKRLFGKKAKGCWLPECAYRQGYEYTGKDGKKKWRPAIEVTLQNNDIEYFFTESHVIEGGNSIGNRRNIGVYGNIEYIPLPKREATGYDTYSAYWLPDAQVAVMGRNDRAGFQVWSAADKLSTDKPPQQIHFTFIINNSYKFIL